jgi:hypothetical protein
MPAMIGKLIGRILRRPHVRDKLIEIAKRTPDYHIVGDDGSTYMARYWLFNPIAGQKRKYPLIPFSIRIHHIIRADRDRHLHDHPWSARTWILDGWYIEGRDEWVDEILEDEGECFHKKTVWYRRAPGDTARLGFKQYHRIAQVADGGAWTLFVFGRYRGTWGFLVDGQKVGFRQYEMRKKCEAVQHSDQVLCRRCGIGWDVNDPCRPDCQPIEL